MERSKKAIEMIKASGDELLDDATDEQVEARLEEIFLEVFGRCACRADEAEPIFTLRARDAVAPRAVEEWADAGVVAGMSEHRVNGGRVAAEAMRLWQAEHGSKVPD